MCECVRDPIKIACHIYISPWKYPIVNSSREGREIEILCTMYSSMKVTNVISARVRVCAQVQNKPIHGIWKRALIFSVIANAAAALLKQEQDQIKACRRWNGDSRIATPESTPRPLVCWNAGSCAPRLKYWTNAMSPEGTESRLIFIRRSGSLSPTSALVRSKMVTSVLKIAVWTRALGSSRWRKLQLHRHMNLVLQYSVVTVCRQVKLPLHTRLRQDWCFDWCKDY